MRRLRGVTTGDGLRARLIRGALGSAGVQAANRVLAVVMGIVLARMLGPGGYGVYAYAFALMNLLLVIAEAGVPNLLMREVAASAARGEWGLLRGALRRSVQFVTLASTTVALLGLMVVWALAEALAPAMLWTTILMLLLLPMSAGEKTVGFALRGLNRVVLGQTVDMLLRPVLVLALAIAVFSIWPEWRQPQAAMAAQFLAAVVVVTGGWFILRRVMPAPARTAQLVCRNREWLRSAMPFILIGGAGIINSNTDIIMLGWFTDAEEVGIYRVAVQGATLVAFGLQVVNTVVAPHFSRLCAQGDMARLQQLATRSARAVLLVATPVALLLTLAGGALVRWVFGVEFAAAHAPLAILAIGYLINAAFGPVGALLMMTGNQGVTAAILLRISFLNVILNAIFIPFFDGVGAAIATSVCVAALPWVLSGELKKRMGLSSSAWSSGRSGGDK